MSPSPAPRESPARRAGCSRCRRRWSVPGPFCVQYILPPARSSAIPTAQFDMSALALSGATVTSVSMLDPSVFGAHDAHPFAVRPVKLAVRGIELQLLGSMRSSHRHDRRHVRAIEFRAEDVAVVDLGEPARRGSHVRPVDVAAGHVHGDAVRLGATRRHDRLRLRAVGADAEHAPSAEVQVEQRGHTGRCRRVAPPITTTTTTVCRRGRGGRRGGRAGRGRRPASPNGRRAYEGPNRSDSMAVHLDSPLR